MLDFQQKRKMRAFTESRVIWVILLILATFVLISAYDRYQIARDMAERRAEVEREAKQLEERRAELEAEVRYLSNERGMEAEMRRQFDIAREGEQVVIIVEAEGSQVEPLATSTNSEEKRAWYRFW
jgi:cell division protein FtsB